ncbi:MAG: nuclear transport factor 2 family protein [Steroidobacteraceae bacterium]|jgi:hypothetical protein|nr:nuclear transport factor 2 family protein [Steroidobacteraceae bacterium]
MPQVGALVLAAPLGVAALLVVAGCAWRGDASDSRGGTSGAAARAGDLPTAVITRRVAEIEALERRRFAAMVALDRAALDEVLAERLRHCHSDGRCETKPQFLEALGSGRLRYRAIEVLELEPKVVGTAMVVQGRLGVQVESQGQPAGFRLGFTDVYEPTPSGWRMVAWQSTRLP